LQGGDFAVDHYVDRLGQIEFDAAHGAPRGQGMIDVCAVVKFWQHTQKAKRPMDPADEFD